MPLTVKSALRTGSARESGRAPSYVSASHILCSANTRVCGTFFNHDSFVAEAYFEMVTFLVTLQFSRSELSFRHVYFPQCCIGTIICLIETYLFINILCFVQTYLIMKIICLAEPYLLLYFMSSRNILCLPFYMSDLDTYFIFFFGCNKM